MENGSLERMSGKEKEDKSGQMDQCMRAGGKIIRLMAREDLSMLMVMFMMGNGSMIRHMDSESTAILTVPNMRATGKKINNTVMVLRHGLMVLDMKANIFKERSMDTEDSHGLTEALITESSSKTTFKEKEYITGLTRENMMALG